MTTNQVLTDAEIEDMAWIHYCNKHGFARAVEQAVLAKVDSEPCRCSRDGYVRKADAERDARKRERAAWDASQLFMWGRSLAFKDFEVSSRKSKEERDRMFPLPTCDKCGQELK